MTYCKATGRYSTVGMSLAFAPFNEFFRGFIA
jgi:hypothetical protein